MQLRYDEDFIEAAVFLCASGRRKGVPSLQINRFHREREKLYGILDADDRNTAFFKLHLDWFREWGLEQPLTDVLKEFPLVRTQLGTLAVRKTAGRSDEGAELYVNAACQRTGLLALRPEWIAAGSTAFRTRQGESDDHVHAVPQSSNHRPLKWAEARAPMALHDFLRHEFTHLHDMLDPAFGYSPALDLPGLNAAQMRLARERYRLLWDITIDGRLAAASHTPMVAREQHAAAFARGYSFWSETRQTETFNSLWQTNAPHHADFLALIGDPRGLRDAHGPAPGASCSLCDFPTFEWADGNALTDEIVGRIKTEFRMWLPEQGLCNRCLETYQAAAGMRMAITTWREALMLTVEHLFISPGHNFFGHHGQPAGDHPIVAVERIECVAGRGIRGDRFFDYKENYKGQITFFAMEVLEALRRELNLPEAQPQATRRNAFVRGLDLNTLIGKQFELQGVRFEGMEESKPCHWMNAALGPGAEEWLRGRAGLRCRILTDGVLRCER